jgi:hypothetical protein
MGSPSPQTPHPGSNLNKYTGGQRMAKYNRTGRKKRTDNLLEYLDRFPLKGKIQIARDYYNGIMGK